MTATMIAVLLLGAAAGVWATDCAAGYKHKATLTSLYCTTSATSGLATSATCSACCEADVTKCGGLTGISCAATSFADSLSTTWKNTAATDATKNTACCATKATCSAATCRAGYKMKTGVASTACTSDAASCAVGTTCCEADALKCGGISGISCDAATHVNPWTAVWSSMVGDTTFTNMVNAWKNTACTDANKNTVCCQAKATCASATCPAGYKMKSGVSTTKCSTMDASSCAIGTTCCEADVTKCGGLTGITCAATHYADTTSTTWKNTAATDATKNTACCATKATCSAATCPAGYKMKTGVASTACASNAASCAVGSTCCEADPLKCGGLTGISCTAATHYNAFTTTHQYSGSSTAAVTARNAWLNTAATEATKNTACCTAKATCAAFQAYTAPTALVAGSHRAAPVVLGSMLAALALW